MASVILGDEQSDVLQGGQITLTNLFETYIGSGEGGVAADVTITISAVSGPGGGQGTPVPATSAGLLAQSVSQYQYVWAVPAGQVPGDYLVTWTGNVAGTQLEYQQTVTVAAIPPGAPAPGVYATASQYQAWSGDDWTPPGMVQVALRRASELMDHYTIGAVYATNANGMPTDAMVIDTFMRATCAQAQFMIASNDPANVKGQYAATNVGGVSVTRAAKMQAMAFPPLAPQAAAILHAAGVLGAAPLVNW